MTDKAGRLRRLRDISGRAWFRHLGGVLIAAAAVYLFAELRAEWSPMHKWNRAFGDASLVLVAMTMAIGPMSRLWSRAKVLLPWRRELGIWAVVAGGIHTVIIFDGWIEWDLARLVGFVFHPGLGDYVMLDKGFGFGNMIGIAALLYGFVLAITSNNLSQRVLGMPVWKFIQQAAYVLWALVVAHTAYFYYIHFLDFHRRVPEPNALQWPFAILVSAVLALQIAASVKTWRLRRRRDGAGGVGFDGPKTA